MLTQELLNTPMLWINKYLQEKLTGIPGALSNGAGLGVPFFPSTPSTIDDLTEQWIVINDTQYQTAGVMATWDRMFRMRRSPFPHIKSEQALYYFYATAEGVTSTMVQVQELVYRLLDRGNESAEEVNEWAKLKAGSADVGGFNPKFYFHDFKVYQLEEVRDIIDFGTARTYGGNKIIIDYTYHQMPELTNNDLSL